MRVVLVLSLLFHRGQAFVIRSKQRPSFTSLAAVTAVDIEIGPHLGSGSYGTVHLLSINGQSCIGKRAWNRSDIDRFSATLSATQRNDKAERCRLYFEAEVHALQKVPPHPSLPVLLGEYRDVDDHIWMAFALIGDKPACSLQDVLELEHSEHEGDQYNDQEDPSHLARVAEALGLARSAPLVSIMDVLLTQLLDVLSHLHAHAIVHRDVKPSNLLLADQRLVLIDFGSSADLDTAGLLGRNIGLSERVAISPIYTAPEVFVNAQQPSAALTFDCFSAGLLTCQLLFQLTDERTDAGFHQQLAAVDWHLDDWLRNELAGKVTPGGLDAALEVLQERPGLWNLLQRLLTADPRDRVKAAEAAEEFGKIRQGLVDPAVDGAYLNEVLQSLELCLLPTLRPLQFVATFRRSEPLGLVLAEVDAQHDDDDELDALDLAKWKAATARALPGEVFVRKIIKGGQADSIGIFEVGDQLQGVGELPLGTGGFQRAVAMLQDQPKSAKYVTLHFDREPAVTTVRSDSLLLSTLNAPIQVADRGAWSTRGRRKSQEDAFILHEVYDTRQRSILLAGVMDGHLGTAASSFVAEKLPEAFSTELLRHDDSSADKLLERSWNDVCDAYRALCDNEEQCAAEYDAREGILMANTGSADAVAGTTAALMALDVQTSHLAILNCGDSRAIIIDGDGQVQFQTVDHSPGSEAELSRLEEGREQGLAYSQPECRVSKWVLPVGEYVYALSRSLEGPFAASTGIVSTPDMSLVQAEPGMTSMAASDGLWEVISSNEASHILTKLRYEQQMSAGDASKTLCSLAVERGSSDNVSVVVVYLD